MKNVSVLFVCMGNICRSPTAEGVFTYFANEAGLTQQLTIDSAGTHAYHVGEPSDRRSQATALKRGFDLGHIRARKVCDNDFEVFDYILAMDRDNLDILEAICPAEHSDKLSLFLAFAPELSELEVPDPYYGGPQGFDHVLDLIEAASQGLIAQIKS